MQQPSSLIIFGEIKTFQNHISIYNLINKNRNFIRKENK